MEEVEKKLVGKITHYFNKIGVAIIELSDELSLGDDVSIEGPTTSFTQNISSMQIEKNPVDKALAGQSIGLKVDNRVRENDSVYKILK